MLHNGVTKSSREETMVGSVVHVLIEMRQRNGHRKLTMMHKKSFRLIALVLLRARVNMILSLVIL